VQKTERIKKICHTLAESYEPDGAQIWNSLSIKTFLFPLDLGNGDSYRLWGKFIMIWTE